MPTKEPYFTTETIERKSLKMLHKLRSGTTRARFTFTPAKSALLVVDMQDYFLKPESHAFIPAAPAVIPRVNGLVRLYSEHELPVIFTRHVNTHEDAKLMAKWWRELIGCDDPLSRITERLDTSAGTVIGKSQYDAFYRTSLEDLLHERGVTQLVISGIMTNLCCETTARSAFVRGFEVFFLVDGTAAYLERFHVSTLTNLSAGFAVLVCAREIANAMEQVDDS